MHATSYPRLGLVCHSRPCLKGLGSVGYRWKGMRACWPPGGGSYGNGGGGDDWEFFDGGEDDPKGFGWLAVFSLFTESPSKQECFTIASNGSNDEEEEKEETPTYIKPAPRPKPESLSYGQFSSWLLLALLLSGGIFLWRRSRRQRSNEDEEQPESPFVQRTRDIELPTEQQDSPAGAEPSAQGTASVDRPDPELQDGHDPSTPDFSKELEDHDALFDIDREIIVEPGHTAVEGFVHQPEDRPDHRDRPEPKGDPLDLPVDHAAGQAFKKSAELDPEVYNADLDDKDAFFGVKHDVVDQGCSVSSKIEVKDNDPLIKEPLTEMDKENEEQDRSTTPPSYRDGSNQSSATQFNEEGEDEASDEEDFNFEKYVPDDQPIVEEDLGPPIKPSAVDFTKPVEWEKETNGKWGKPTIDDKTSTLRYLLSNTDLLTEALKQMESTEPTDSEIVSKQETKKPKKKRNRSKRKKASAEKAQF